MISSLDKAQLKNELRYLCRLLNWGYHLKVKWEPHRDSSIEGEGKGALFQYILKPLTNSSHVQTWVPRRPILWMGQAVRRDHHAENSNNLYSILKWLQDQVYR